MMAILGFSEMLSNDIDFVQEEAEAHAAVQTLHRNASHLLTISNDILDMSQIEAGKLEVELIEVDPLQILEESVSFVRRQAVAKRPGPFLSAGCVDHAMKPILPTQLIKTCGT